MKVIFRSFLFLFALPLCIMQGCTNPSVEMSSQEILKSQPDTSKKIILAEADLALKKDPVCGMPAFKFLKDTAHFDGKIYGFCGKGCKQKFTESPAEYLKKFSK